MALRLLAAAPTAPAARRAAAPPRPRAPNPRRTAAAARAPRAVPPRLEVEALLREAEASLAADGAGFTIKTVLVRDQTVEYLAPLAPGVAAARPALQRASREEEMVRQSDSETKGVLCLHVRLR
jgi:hypothetical protein